jgi:hypothetical protein
MPITARDRNKWLSRPVKVAYVSPGQGGRRPTQPWVREPWNLPALKVAAHFRNLMVNNEQFKLSSLRCHERPLTGPTFSLIDTQGCVG